MVSDGITAARIQARYSPLISSTWAGMAFQANVLSAVRHATGWLNRHPAVARAAGRCPIRQARGPGQSALRPPRTALTW